MTADDRAGQGMFHAYLYLANTEAGNRVILAENVTYAEAEAACRAQRIYLPKLGRMGDTWYSAGFLPRLAIVNAETEPYDFLSPNPIHIEDLLARLSANYDKR